MSRVRFCSACGARLRKAPPVTYFHAVPRDGRRGPGDPDEVAEVGWFPPDRLPAAIAFPHHVVRALRAWRAAYRTGRTVTPLGWPAGGPVERPEEGLGQAGLTEVLPCRDATASRQLDPRRRSRWGSRRSYLEAVVRVEG